LPPTCHPAPRLLILDDDEAVLLPMARYFRAMGYDTVTAREVEEAEAILTCDRVDAAILDLSLSGFGPDGLEVLRSIRARSDDLPVVILSGNIRPDVEDETRSLGATAVLAKPQSLEELERVVARALGRRW
jgi:CheY-like chemotaxis protein